MSALEYNLDQDLDVTIRRRGKTRLLIILGVLLIVTLTTGAYFIGFYVRSNDNGESNSSTQDAQHNFQKNILKNEIEKNLRFFSRRPHAAGSARQLELAKYIENLWKSYGFDDVELPGYKVMLSKPREDKPNIVELIENGKVVHEIIGKLNVTAGPGESETFQYIPYVAYSSNGTVEGQLVYVNEGTKKDFKTLKAYNISVEGKIVICRRISGNVLEAAKHGAIGALFYPDPSTYSQAGQSDEDMYPNTVWSSSDSIYEKPVRSMFGDPLTPGLPALPGMYRRPLNETSLPTIPSQPISFEDARKLLSRMNGSEVPEIWRGALNLTYRFGPGFTTSNTTVRIKVHNIMKETKIYNVIGTIRGREEPDRIVLIGNHRDAWLFGAVDPSSGTATLIEMSRVIGNLLKTGWRPRRTIMFCSWGAEEFGLVGSVEWVEQHSKLLNDRAIAYLNTDVAVGGNFVLVVQSCPLLVDFIFSWAKKVRDPNAHGSKTSLYDIMTERMPLSKTRKGEPTVLSFRYMSDYYPFYMNVGVPSADFSYFFGYKNQWQLYPVYHTQHDTFYWVKKFIDPEFKFHEAMAKFQGGMLLDLADLPLLPYGIQRLSDSLKDAVKSPGFLEFKKLNLHTDHVIKAVNKFGNASKEFLEAKNKLTGKESDLVRRIFNDQMVQVEKALLRADLYSRDPINRHVIIGNIFIGVHNAKVDGNLKEANKQLSAVAEAFSSAADVLKPLKSLGFNMAPSVFIQIWAAFASLLICLL